MEKFISKPITIEAIRCREAHYKMGHDWYSLPKWFIDAYEGKNESGIKTILGVNYPEKCIEIVTDNGVLKADIEDWIISGIMGEIYPCKPDVFRATYEFAEK